MIGSAPASCSFGFIMGAARPWSARALPSQSGSHRLSLAGMVGKIQATVLYLHCSRNIELEAVDIVGPELTFGEHIRWMGMPSFRSILLRSLPPIAFGLVFIIVPFIPTVTWSENLPANFPKAAIAMLCVAVGSNSSYRALLDVLTVGKTAYAVTDRRILVVRLFLGRRVQSIMPDAINIVEHKRGANGYGSVFFRRDDVHGLDANGTQKLGFWGVPDVIGAVRALDQLRAQPTK